MLKKAFYLLFRFVSFFLLDICFFWANFDETISRRVIIKYNFEMSL